MAEKTARRGTESRNRTVMVHVRCLPEERDEIKAKADGCGQTVSSFMRDTALNRQIVSMIDHTALREFVRLGSLQKHLFTEGKRLGDKEYSAVLSAIIALANETRAKLREK